jgi:CheY-like chemotaxis protein
MPVEFDRPIHILLADDDIDDRGFFEKALLEIPIACQLTMVQDGEQLMDYLNKHTMELPDVLFLDLSMPRKTGFECLTEIKENLLFSDLSVVVFTTSLTTNPDFEQTMIRLLSGIGAHEYIRKPSGFDHLKEIIHRVLKDVRQKLDA